MKGLARIVLLGPILLASLAYCATWTTVEVPGSIRTQVYGINDAADLVGSYTDATHVIHGFVLTGGTYVTLDAPGAISTVAWSINNNGQIVGSFFDRRKRQGFFFDAQNFVPLNFPDAIQTSALGINDSGQVVGTYLDANQKTHGFTWNNGIFASLDFPGSNYTSVSGINNRGHIVGVFIDARNLDHGFLLNTHGQLRRLGPDLDSTAVNDHNVVVGFREKDGFWFNLRKYSFRLLQFPGAADTKCYGVNSAGDVVGVYHDARDLPHAFLRTR